MILFTSGTTGPSKGAVLSHRANFSVASSTCALMGYGEDEVLFNVFPLYHVNARYTSVLPSMWLDRGTLRAPRPLLGLPLLGHLPRRGCDRVQLHGRARADALQAARAGRRRRQSGARAPTGRLRRSRCSSASSSASASSSIEVYGSTELGACLQNRRGERRIGSCGREAPHYIVEIHDEDDNPVGPGVEGEIVVRPREPHVMVEEYFGAPEASLAAFRNLWFHTGDRGRTDEDGWFYYVDRLKDAIRRRGENISSWEVEQVVNDHEAVAESAAIGIPSELTEEEVMVVVVLQEGAELAPEALLDFCQDRLPHFAVPRYVRFVDELPKNHAQRIQKQELRAEARHRGHVGPRAARVRGDALMRLASLPELQPARAHAPEAVAALESAYDAASRGARPGARGDDALRGLRSSWGSPRWSRLHRPMRASVPASTSSTNSSSTSPPSTTTSGPASRPCSGRRASRRWRRRSTCST